MFWAALARQFGRRVLSPLCATGAIAAQLAGRGLRVTAFDLEGAMVRRAAGRSTTAPGLGVVQADALRLPFAAAHFDFAFLATGDFHHFLTEASQIAVLRQLRRCVRPGGGLALALFPPPEPRSERAGPTSSPMRRFEPFSPPAADDVELEIWSQTIDGPDPHARHIRQTLKVRRPAGVEEITYEVRLRLSGRDELERLLRTAGFEPVEAWGSMAREPFSAGSAQWIVLARAV